MKTKFLTFTAFGALMLVSACSGSKKEETVASTVQTTVAEKPSIKVALVTERPVDQIQQYTATVEAEATNNIAPMQPVRIEKIFVEVGDRVRKGQKLVQMDAANLTQLKLQLDNQKVEFQRVDELYKVGGVSKSEWEAAKMGLEVRETSYRNLLDNTALSSPITGVVTARNYDNGDMYSGARPVLTVEQIVPVKLLINVSEIYFTQIAKGQKVKIKLDVYGDDEFEGTVNLVYPTISAATRTFPVEVRVANNDLKIRPGMFARVTLNFGTLNHVVVPDLAIVKQAGSGERFVYVNEGGKVSRKVVELGRRMGEEYELISGVANNSQVVVAGQSKLLDGMEVKVE
ncbi:MAG: efflux RND transporter periplasmic adaptor subunit [Tannerella sp.]|nr:efflux RND transporter periplasmic adaptor subunit [Tannerella sp.]